ncbi:hypothetical protein ACOMHN_000806 [Nucella lapillus]
MRPKVKVGGTMKLGGSVAAARGQGDEAHTGDGEAMSLAGADGFIKDPTRAGVAEGDEKRRSSQLADGAVLAVQ